ncbi:MAG: carboxypeptidase-like regulatory domain-containing protein, partial [Cyclobacteriaceae bacterium]|nr:carboxypeptidase-like regulatory domain-containing protein [Cyclobacteriaceae bacterium]
MNKLTPSLFFTLFIALSAHAQDQVSGIVKDMEGNPVVGATVQEKGTGNFTITDLNGRFNLTPQQQVPFSVEISAVGLQLQEIQIYEIYAEPMEF